MSQRHAAFGIAGIGFALRNAVQQAGGWYARPTGSLITAQPSTSFAAACVMNPVRSLARPANFTGFDPWSFFDYRKFVYPDVYDANEALLCNRYKSHGSVVERYMPPKPFSHWNPLLDPELDRRTKYFNFRLYTSFVCYRSLWGFSKTDLQSRVLAAYKSVNLAIATGDMRYAEPFVTESMLLRLTGEVTRRGRAARVEWRMVSEPDPRDIKLVCGTVVQNPLKQGRLHFVQWTARVPSRQVVAVYDARGNLIAGDPHKELDVVDYWVFERPILKALVAPRPGPQGAEWRLLERLQT
ncbi:hypothetical protein VOLCADRAFT_106869 [Volvox carteri f. nagariensis]|uniref:Large ribosomal subunit protein mL45 n=1 Tax=Volvox carteri f. nagariensis TaxID=3068 RepID=D8UAB3_VOLCA|nr:uncharacterized protein VOLCADRAFT_106869 [Volvox carteri f. nagariensis]EFJ43288.1 hypothetical protein VOLCADRAFT_106869 [Volvox carteri f. nagariensis]|eukprot:XP_002955648.1 hypothetical protein VOLCADRAFT_106869 [Volvox carteri f. nagariensis]